MECPNGDLVIRFTPAGEETQIITGADNYILENEVGQCPVKYYAFGTFFSKNSSAGGCNVTAYWRSRKALLPSEVESWDIDDSTGIYGIKHINGELIRAGRISEQQHNDESFRTISSRNYIAKVLPNAACQNRTIPAYASSAEVTKLIREDRLEDNCGKYILVVSKLGGIVYAREFDEPPEVETYCSNDRCPPGSCECLCDDTVCCYHPKTGAVLKSFSKQ